MNDQSTEKMGLVERSARTFESYVNSELYKHFLSEKFLHGIAEQRNQIHQRSTLAFARLLLFTVFLGFFDSLGEEVAVAGVEIPLSKSFSAALSVVVASSFVATVYAMVDQLIIDRCLGKLGEAVGFYSPHLLFIDKTSHGLWSDAITPRYFGPKSRVGHKAAQVISALFSLWFLCFLFILSTGVCAINTVSVVHWAGFWSTEGLLSGASLIICVYGWALLLIFSLPYRFDIAEFNESDAKPTPEFLRRLNEENGGNVEAE